MIWTIAGNVLITVMNTGPYNALVNGLFFDPATQSAIVVGSGPSTGGPGDGTGVSDQQKTDPIGVLDSASTPRSSSPAATLAVHDASLLGIGIGASSDLETNPIGSVDASGDDLATVSLVADPINPDGKPVHDLAIEHVSLGLRRSRARFGQ